MNHIKKIVKVLEKQSNFPQDSSRNPSRFVNNFFQNLPNSARLCHELMAEFVRKFFRQKKAEKDNNCEYEACKYPNRKIFCDLSTGS